MKDECCGYLTAMLGEKIAVEALSASERKRAAWLVNLYALKAASIRGRRHILAFAKAGQRYTPVSVAKQLAMGREALGLPFVYVPRELGTHDIPRLIAANVPYVMAKRSLFLPEAGLTVTRAPESPVLREKFSAPAQLLVLGYMLKKWDGVMTIGDGEKRTGFRRPPPFTPFRKSTISARASGCAGRTATRRKFGSNRRMRFGRRAATGSSIHASGRSAWRRNQPGRRWRVSMRWRGFRP